MSTRERDHRQVSPRSGSQSQSSSIHTIPRSVRGFLHGCSHHIKHVHLFNPLPPCVGQIVPSYSGNLLRLPRPDEPPTENRNPMWRTSLVKLHGTSVRFGPTSCGVHRQDGRGIGEGPDEPDERSSERGPQKRKVRVDFPSLGPCCVRFTSGVDLMHWRQGLPCVRNPMP